MLIRPIVATFATLSVLVTSPAAFEATITAAAPVAPHPVGKVVGGELPLIEGTQASSQQERVSPYAHVDRPRPARIPVPTPNPVAVSWCLSENI